MPDTRMDEDVVDKHTHIYMQWKQPKCLTHEWMKMWYQTHTHIYAMEYYSAINRVT